MKWLPILILLLTGCATGYHNTSFSGGFSELELSPNVWKISFKGNGYTSTDRAEDFAMLRACDLVLSRNLKYFRVLKQNDSVSQSVSQLPSTSYTTAYGSSYGNNYYGNAYTTTMGGGSVVIRKPRTSIVVEGLLEKPPTGFAFDASFLRPQLAKQYHVQ